MGNYKDCLTDIKGMIDIKYPLPLHQGIADVTEYIEFARLAEEHNLTDKQYERLIEDGDEYYQNKVKLPQLRG